MALLPGRFQRAFSSREVLVTLRLATARLAPDLLAAVIGQ
jgi:hypothetical protein